MSKTQQELQKEIDNDIDIKNTENKTANETALTLGRKILLVLKQILDVLQSK
jgi:hypothetical protein